MKKWDIPLKVAFGYTFIIVVFGMAVILVYGYTRSAVRLSDVERAMTVRWDAAGSLVYSILEVENLERAVCMGDVVPRFIPTVFRFCLTIPSSVPVSIRCRCCWIASVITLAVLSL